MKLFSRLRVIVRHWSVRWLLLPALVLSLAYGGYCLREAMRPPSHARWQAEMTASQKTRFDFMTKERHYKAAIKETRRFGKQDIRLAQSLYAYGMLCDGYTDYFNVPAYSMRNVRRTIGTTLRHNPRSLLPVVKTLYKRRHIWQVTADVVVVKLFDEAYAIFTAPGAPHDPSQVEAYRNLAGYYSRCRQFDKAEALYQRVVDTERQYHGLHDEKTISAMRFLADFYYSTGRAANALSIYQQLYADTQQKYGVTSREADEALRAIASIQEGIGDFHAAIVSHRTIIAHEEQREGKYAPRLYWPLNDIIQVYAKMGDSEQAQAIREHIRQIELRNPNFIPH